MVHVSVSASGNFVASAFLFFYGLIELEMKLMQLCKQCTGYRGFM